MKIIYVTGWLRSGSTILGNVLNELPGVLHVGELHYLWQNGVLRSGTNSLCGCGEQVRQCPLWSAVLAGMGEPDVEELATRVMGWQRTALRTRHTRARLATPTDRAAANRADPAADRAVVTPDRAASVTDRLATPTDRAASAVDRMVAIYRTLAGLGADRAVVDSSKYPAEAAALLHRPDLDVRVLHIVRDPRATAYSYQRSKNYIEPMSPARSTANWVAFNAASELVGRAARGRYLRVRHEDLTSRPREVLADVLRFAGLDDESPVGEDGKVTLGVNHTVTGNPDRLGQGVVSIRPDERWRTGLPRRDHAVSTAVALPLLRRYGYPLLSGKTG